MPRYSIKDLLLAVLLISVGIVLLSPLFRMAPEPLPWYMDGILPILVMWFGGCSMIGAGLFAPFQRKAVGACVGAALALMYVVIVYLTLPTVY